MKSPRTLVKVLRKTVSKGEIFSVKSFSGMRYIFSIELGSMTFADSARFDRDILVPIVAKYGRKYDEMLDSGK